MFVAQCCNRVTGSPGQRFGWGHGSVWQTRCLTRFCSFCTRFIVAFWSENTPSWDLWDSVYSVFSRRLVY